MANSTQLEGGCLCGAVRYRVACAPLEAGYCHCGVCRRSSGAPVLAFATVPRADFTLIAGAPRKRRSTSFGERWFCADCGTQLVMCVDHQPDTIDFTLASLDNPTATAPEFHIFFGSRIGWFDIADRLPRHKQFRPHTPGLSDSRIQKR
jgi:hypothetical protein